MGWWIALGVVFLLGILPLGISARYSGEGPLLRVVIGPVRLTLFPRKKKEKKPKPAKKTAEQPKSRKNLSQSRPSPPSRSLRRKRRKRAAVCWTFCHW